MDDQPTRNSQPLKAYTPEPRLHSRSVNDRLIAERVTTLLSHYWTAADAPEVRKLQLADWIEDLSGFAAATVAEACAEWRHKPGGKRPTPGDIRTICVESRERREYLRLPALPAPGLDPSVTDFHKRRYREAAEAREAWARAHGCQSFKDAMAIGLVAVSKMTVVQ